MSRQELANSSLLCCQDPDSDHGWPGPAVGVSVAVALAPSTLRPSTNSCALRLTEPPSSVRFFAASADTFHWPAMDDCSAAGPAIRIDIRTIVAFMTSLLSVASKCCDGIRTTGAPRRQHRRRDGNDDDPGTRRNERQGI